MLWDVRPKLQPRLANSNLLRRVKFTLLQQIFVGRVQVLPQDSHCLSGATGPRWCRWPRWPGAVVQVHQKTFLRFLLVCQKIHWGPWKTISNLRTRFHTWKRGLEGGPFVFYINCMACMSRISWPVPDKTMLIPMQMKGSSSNRLHIARKVPVPKCIQATAVLPAICIVFQAII